MGAEGAGLDLGERFWAFRPPADTGAGNRERGASARSLTASGAARPSPGAQHPSEASRSLQRPGSARGRELRGVSLTVRLREPRQTPCASATPRRSATAAAAAALQSPPPPSGGAGVTASEPQCRSTPAARLPPGGRARRSLRASILPPTPRPPAPLPLDCGRRKPLQERAPARARPRPARRRPDSGGAWTRGSCSCGGGPRRARAPERLPGRRGRARARLRSPVCLLARSCLIMVYFLPERLL